MIKTNSLDLFIELVKTSFKMRYQNSILGVLWVLIKPYSTFIVMYLVWTRILNQNLPNYSVYLLLGIIVYTFISEMIILGQMSLLDRAGIILKVNFPRQIAVISSLFTAVINFIINMVLVIFITIISGVQFNILGMVYIIFVAIIAFIFCIGLAFFTSVITIKFRDLKNVFELAIFLLYWATPIVYVIDNANVTGNFSDFVAANPIGIIINQVRAALGIYGSINFPLMVLYLVFSCLFATAGWIYFSRKVKIVAEFF